MRRNGIGKAGRLHFAANRFNGAGLPGAVGSVKDAEADSIAEERRACFSIKLVAYPTYGFNIYTPFPSEIDWIPVMNGDELKR